MILSKVPARTVRVLLLIASLVISATFLEFASGRLLKTVRPEPLPRVLIHQVSPNLKLLYKPVPNARNIAYVTVNQINSLGFRGGEYARAKPAGVTRILFLGDSVVYGFGLWAKDTIPQQLETLFRSHGKKVEVMNFGVCGYDSEQSVEFFNELGLDLDPDIVILGYTLNDSTLAGLEVTLLHEKIGYQVPVKRKDAGSRVLEWFFYAQPFFHAARSEIGDPEDITGGSLLEAGHFELSRGDEPEAERPA